jgi:hypothetical protein
MRPARASSAPVDLVRFPTRKHGATPRIDNAARTRHNRALKSRGFFARRATLDDEDQCPIL